MGELSGFTWPKRKPGAKPRSAEQLPPPSADIDYTPFPTASNPATIYRAVTRGNGAWWFASAPENPTPENAGGRFDLPRPRGTSYWGDSPDVALGERLGAGMVATPGSIPRRLITGIDIRSADGPNGKFADLGGKNVTSVFGVTGELSTTSNYPLAQAYAVALRAAGMDGIRYRARFSGDGPPNAVAVFDDNGQHEDTTRQVDPDIIQAEPIAVGMGLTVVDSASTIPPTAHHILTSLPPMRKRPTK